jgi:hypothetical protein
MRTILLGLVFLVACSNSRRNNPEPDAPGPTADASTDATVPGAFCGGFLAIRCADTEYCDYEDNLCGIADGGGVCKPRPGACPQVVGPLICGCDGKVHSSACVTFSTGTDFNAHGSCDVPAGDFACGYTLCNLETEYCKREVKSDTGDVFTCVALPGTCTSATPSCTCLSREVCGTSCMGDARVGLTLTCS